MSDKTPERRIKTVSAKVTQSNFDWIEEQTKAPKVTKSSVINAALTTVRLASAQT